MLLYFASLSKSVIQQQMQAIQQSLMQMLIKIVSPASPAYGNNVAFEMPQMAAELKKKLLPGDVIFSRTNSSLYQMARRFIKGHYDHVAVVISSNQVIHISPPIISKISIDLFIHPSREPLILRPKLEDHERYLTVLNNFLGEQYNSKGIVQAFIKEIKSRLENATEVPFSFANLKYSRVCSDAVLYSLCRGSKTLQNNLEGYVPSTRHSVIGFFSPDEVAKFLSDNNAQVILKSKETQEYPIISAIFAGTQSLPGWLRQSRGDSVSGFRKLIERVQQQQKGVSGPQRKWLGELVQILVLGLALGQGYGVLVSKKLQYMLLFLNTVLMVGHFKELRHQLSPLPKL